VKKPIQGKRPPTRRTQNSYLFLSSFPPFFSFSFLFLFFFLFFFFSALNVFFFYFDFYFKIESSNSSSNSTGQKDKTLSSPSTNEKNPPTTPVSQTHTKQASLQISPAVKPKGPPTPISPRPKPSPETHLKSSPSPEIQPKPSPFLDTRTKPSPSPEPHMKQLSSIKSAADARPNSALGNRGGGRGEGEGKGDEEEEEGKVPQGGPRITRSLSADFSEQEIPEKISISQRKQLFEHKEQPPSSPFSPLRDRPHSSLNESPGPSPGSSPASSPVPGGAQRIQPIKPPAASIKRISSPVNAPAVAQKKQQPQNVVKSLPKTGEEGGSPWQKELKEKPKGGGLSPSPSSPSPSSPPASSPSPSSPRPSWMRNSSPSLF